jgi:hypothetical protein
MIGLETAEWSSVEEKKVIVLGMLVDVGQDPILCPGKSWVKE